MIADAQPRGVLFPAPQCAGAAVVFRAGVQTLTRTDGLRIPDELLRLLDELDALAHEHAAACQARGPSRDSTTE